MTHERTTVLNRASKLVTIAASGLILGLFSNAQASVRGYDLPDLGNPSAQAMSPAKAHRMGARIYAKLRSKQLIVDDPQLVEFIRGIGQRLLAHTTKNGQHVTYHVINRSDLNAFTVPGGYIAVFTGAIASSSNESELAAVMAHETAHATQHHVVQQIAAMKGVGLEHLTMMLVGAIAGASTGNYGAIPAAATGSITNMQKQRASFSRSEEAEADRLGIHTMTYAHFNPNAMITLLKKLKRQENTNGIGEDMNGIGNLLTGFLSVPTAGKRIPDMEERINNLPKLKVRTSAIFPLMRERARVIQSNTLSRLSNHFKTKLAHGEDNEANAYGYALTLIRLGRANQAINVLTPYAQSHPNEAPWQLALARAEKAIGQKQVALTRLKKAKNKFENNSAVKLAYASTLLACNKPGAMREFLLSKDQLVENWAQAQTLLAKGAHQQGRLGEAYFRRAKAYAMRDEYPRAINQLRSVLQTAKLNSHSKSRLSALRTQLTLTCNRTYGTNACRQAVKKLAKQSDFGG